MPVGVSVHGARVILERANRDRRCDREHPARHPNRNAMPISASAVLWSVSPATPDPVAAASASYLVSTRRC